MYLSPNMIRTLEALYGLAIRVKLEELHWHKLYLATITQEGDCQ